MIFDETSPTRTGSDHKPINSKLLHRMIVEMKKIRKKIQDDDNSNFEFKNSANVREMKK